MSEHLDVWIAARALIAERRNWCKGSIARDICGSPIWPVVYSSTEAVLSPRAFSFCLAGAMGRAAGRYQEGMHACMALADAVKMSADDRVNYPGGFNDYSSHAEVLALLDKGIALGRASRTLPSLLDIPASPTRVNETV